MYLYMLKTYLQNNILTNPKLKLFQNDIANNEIALTAKIFQRRCLKLVHTRPSWPPRPRSKNHKTKSQSLSALSGPSARTHNPKGPARTRLQSILKFFMTPIPVNNHIEIHAWHRLSELQKIFSWEPGKRGKIFCEVKLCAKYKTSLLATMC